MAKSIIALFKEAGIEARHARENPELGDVVACKAMRGSHIFGTCKPEPYPTGRDHFKPRFRHVAVMGPSRGRNPDGTPTPVFYTVTSDIHGSMRGYRCRHWFDTTVGNIFAYAPTQRGAVLAWLEKFKNKTYNKRQ